MFYHISRCSEKDLIEIEKIIENHPRRFTRSSNDPDHIVNQKNFVGIRPLYEAARNGHL